MTTNYTLGLNPEKQQAFEMLKRFVSGGQEQVFVLTGYAGTGKTTLVKSLAQYCRDSEIPLSLLATTGRAAKVLASKTGFSAETLHRQMYSLDFSELDEATQTKKIRFRLNTNTTSLDHIYVVDESSMISDKPLSDALTLFGTGSVLDDLMQYAGKRKLIFVGDSAQLPPINSRMSPALSLAYLTKKYGFKGTALNLQQVMRYQPGSAIYENSQKLLQVIHSGNFQGRLQLRAGGHQGIRVFALDTQMISDFTGLFRRFGYTGCIFLTLSNRLATEVNRQVRALLHGTGAPVLVKGEVLMVQQNNYKHDVANGEHIEVLQVTGPEERRAELTFIPVEARVNEPAGQRTFRSLLVREYLELQSSRLSNEAEFKLTQDFMIRMRQKGIDPKKQSEEFNTFMQADPYLNAIRARYGYAVTCHKAQGGEWPRVFIILEKGLWNPTEPELKFKWTYTAITRSEQELNFLENWAII